MKILWICNIPTPEISEKIGITKYNTGGWLTGLSSGIAARSDIELHFLFPTHEIFLDRTEKIGNITYHALVRRSRLMDRVDKSLSKRFAEFAKYNDFDIIHMFGTELPFNRLAISLFDKRKFVTSIQGLVSVYQMHYMANLPFRTQFSFTIYEMIMGLSLRDQQQKFRKRGLSEIEIINDSFHIIGRTDWDYAISTLINSKVKYYSCNETLRPGFYNSQWDINRIERNTLFISQANYPIKGLHIVLEAMTIIKKHIPNIKLLVGGPNNIYSRGLVSHIKRSTYANYIRRLIARYKLTENVEFIGNLSENQMISTFLRSHIFISPSSIENSSNSLAEAMLLGTPSISSYVGGIPSLFTHKHDGFLYPFDEPYMLAYYVMQIINDDQLALNFSKNSKLRASITHSSLNNSKVLFNIYSSIVNDKSENV